MGVNGVGWDEGILLRLILMCLVEGVCGLDKVVFVVFFFGDCFFFIMLVDGSCGSFSLFLLFLFWEFLICSLLFCFFFVVMEYIWVMVWVCKVEFGVLFSVFFFLL